MELVNCLKTQYGENTPIFFEDIANVCSGYTRGRVYQLIDAAMNSGLLAKAGYDCYYVPTTTPFGKSLLNPRKIIEKKYISNNGKVYGFYTGISLLNSFGITTQMPNVIEVFTNNEATKSRRVTINNQTIIVKRARTTINSANYKEMMLLELFNLADARSIDVQATQKIVDYMKKNNISIQGIMKYAEFVPARAIKNFMSSEVQNAFAY
ncbi:MAG TPA: hypothetical protein DCS37_03905 [Clostridiales bacterium]|nr:hypothetical protein [Clostridiales bacterium]